MYKANINIVNRHGYCSQTTIPIDKYFYGMPPNFLNFLFLFKTIQQRNKIKFELSEKANQKNFYLLM